MSQAVIASRGSASRTVSRRPRSVSRPWPPRFSSMRSLTAATLATPSSGGRPGGARRARQARPSRRRRARARRRWLRSASGRRRRGRGCRGARARTARSSPHRAGCRSRERRRRSLRSSLNAGSSMAVPRASGSSSGNAPLPMYVVATGAPRRSATSRSSSHAPARRTPPPAQTTGVSAAMSSRTASASAFSSGEGAGRGDVSSSPTGASVLPASTSTGISRNTGPLGGVQRPSPRLGQQGRDLVGGLGARGPLHDGLERRLLVGELVQEPASGADQLARDLARDRHDRDVCARRFHERGQRDQRTRPGREEEGRRPPARPRVAVRGEAGRELGAKADPRDRARAQTVPDRERVDPRHPECDLGAERFEALRDEASARTRFDRLRHSSDPIQANGARPPPRHPLRARPDRAEDAPEPVLPGASLHGLREREAALAGALPRNEGRGRLGGRLHRRGARQPRLGLLAGRLPAHLGRRRRYATSRSWPRRPTSTRLSPASS